MIVRTTNEALHLITQPDHAALAGRIMRRWVPLQDEPRRASILRAVEEHDNGWREPDGAPMVDPASGAVLDFIAIPTTVRQSVWPRGVARLSDDPWVAALVAQHAITVYDRFRPDPAWATFFATLEATRDDMVARTTLTLAELLHDYAYVRIGDLISLVYCNQWSDESYAPWRFRRDGDHIHVTPDAFTGEAVAFSIVASEIPNRPYASNDALQEALRAAASVELTGVVSGT